MFFLHFTYFNYIFHVKIQLFVTQKSEQDPDPDPPGFALVLASWIRIRIRIETNADPQH
jgi:hypothetical protein